jgi:hypothetical protein
MDAKSITILSAQDLALVTGGVTTQNQNSNWSTFIWVEHITLEAIGMGAGALAVIALFYVLYSKTRERLDPEWKDRE